MTHTRLRCSLLVTVMLCALATISGCASGEVASTPALPPAANTPASLPTVNTPAAVAVTSAPAPTRTNSTPAATPAAAATSTPAATPTPPEAVFGSGSFILADPTAGLAELAGYKATLTLAFDGLKDAKPQHWSKTYVMLAAKATAAHQLTIAKSGDLADPAPVFMAEMNGTDYERNGQSACNATGVTPGNSLAERLEPAGFLSGVVGAEQAASQTVNGVATDHYTFDERALGAQAVSKSNGELWVAASGGYLVKYVLTTKGAAAYFGKGIEGTLAWDYELTGANQPAVIELPKECLPDTAAIPMLPNATDVQRIAGLLSYSTTASVADAAAFYQKQTPPLGWQPVGDPAITRTFALLNFAQGSKTLKVIISAGQTGATRRIHIELGQQ